MITMLVTALITAAPGAAIPEERMITLRAALVAAEAKWQGAALSNYSYRLVSGGPFGHTTYVVVVEGAQCKARSRTHLGKRVSRWKRDTCDRRRLADLFAEFRRQLSYSQERVELTFDPDTGVPIKASFQPHIEVPDQDEYFEISSFEARRR